MAYNDPPAPTSPAYSGCQGGVITTFSGCATGLLPVYSEGGFPTLLNLAPGSMKAGLVVPITLNGHFLGNVTAVQITGTLIAVTNINVVNDDQLIVTFTLDVAALEGVRQITVVTPDGISNALNITILPGMWLGITTEPALWVEADYGVVDANNAPMTVWSDRTSNANHFTPGPSKSAPIYKSTGWNGGVRPYWQFNNAHGCITAASASLSLTSHTIFLVALRDTGDANSALIFIISDIIGASIQDSAASSYIARWNAPHTVITESSYHNAGGWLPINTRLHIRNEYNGTHATHKLFLSNVQQSLNNQLTGNPGVVAIGSAHVKLGYRDVSLPGFDLQGRIAACVIYPTLLSAPDTTTVHGQIQTKWMS